MKASPFQVVVLSLFGVSIIAGLIVLATTKSTTRGSGVPVTIWGVIPQANFVRAIEELTKGSGGLKITYIEKRPDTFDRELVEALASASGPDAILLPQDLIARERGKIFAIPYNSMPLRMFKDTFIQEGELYLDPSGVLAVPLSVDPLVMYWNRDLLTNASIARPPQTWDEFLTVVPKLTVKGKSLNILKSGVALGEFRNITNAKEIIATFFMQAGNPITTLRGDDIVGALYPSTLGTVSAINFYTDFANPVKPDYAWNRSLPNSRDVFAAGDLAFYFGFASELSKIRDRNPNLNFDVTYFPQSKGAPVSVTFGKMQALAVLKNSRNSTDAFEAVLAITGSGPAAHLSSISGLPPARRDLLSAKSEDPYQAIFYNSAIRSRGWLDPNPVSTASIFQDMIESITAGVSEAGKAIDAAGRDLSTVISSGL